jgi:DNA polymerase-3 subunit epsilon
MRHHRLRSVDLADGVDLTAALEQLATLLGSRPVLGYCVAFDVAVLQRLCRTHLGVPLCNPTLDLRDRFERQWRRAHPDSEPLLDLDSMLRVLSLPPISRHDAYADAVVTAAAWLKLDAAGALAHARDR